MKKFALLTVIVLTFYSCQDKVINKYNSYEPVYESYESFRTTTTFEPPKEITDKGNIYFKDDYLFVVDNNHGIHLIDNSNPYAPENFGYLNLKGCSGLAIRGNYLYAICLIDLVVVDINDIYQPVEVARLENVFPTALPVMTYNYPTETIDKNLGVVVDWKVVQKEEETNDAPVWNNCFECDVFISLESSSGFNNSDPYYGGNVGTGTAGSITKVTIIDDYLYVMDQWQLLPINIANPAAPDLKDPVSVWYEVETLFPHGDYIFMGTRTGMVIYETASNPSAPTYLSVVSHMRACDPVVVQDNWAYVTVRSSSFCGGDINQLDIIDVSDVANPQLMKTYQMKEPHGLGIDNNTLFICDGSDGLKVFDATNPTEAGNHLIKRFGNIEAVDVIPYNGVAMVIGDNGIFQYDYSNPEDLELMSEIKF